MSQDAEQAFDSRAAGWIALRRELHRHPELSGDESRSAERVVQALERLPLTVRTGLAGHGVVADLVGDQPGPTLAYRADLDALPISELSEAEYRSRRDGVMHACGHDVHTAIGVGLAEELARSRDQLHGRLRFIFQPAEEAAAEPGQVIGAEAMARLGVLDGVDAILAVHCMPGLDVERFAIPTRAVWAASDIFRIRLRGRTAHAAYPHQGIDVVQMAAAVVQGLLAIPARSANPLQPCVLTVGTVNAGTAHNILAGEAELSGIVRTFDSATREDTLAAIERVVTGTASAHGGQGRASFQDGAGAVLNDPALRELVVERLALSAGPERVLGFEPQMGAEDFSAFSRRVPACYLFVGVANAARGLIHDLHTPQFDVDERCIPFAVRHLCRLFADLGRQWDPSGAPTMSRS